MADGVKNIFLSTSFKERKFNDQYFAGSDRVCRGILLSFFRNFLSVSELFHFLHLSEILVGGEDIKKFLKNLPNLFPNLPPTEISCRLEIFYE